VPLPFTLSNRRLARGRTPVGLRPLDKREALSILPGRSAIMPNSGHLGAPPDATTEGARAAGEERIVREVPCQRGLQIVAGAPQLEEKGSGGQIGRLIPLNSTVQCEWG
jgi:hypothetical protein